MANMNTRSKGKSTKWWNDCLDDQPPEEKIFVDHKTEARDDPCNLKFKTSDSRLPYWIIAHKEIYRDADWDNSHENTGPRMCVENQSDGKVVVKFHSSGIVVIQANFQKWYDLHWDKLKARVSEMIDNPNQSSYMPEDLTPDEIISNDPLSKPPPAISVTQATAEQGLSDGDSVSITDDTGMVNGLPLHEGTVNSENDSLLSGGKINNSLTDNVQAKYISLIDHSNQAIENFGRSVDSLKTEISRSQTQLHTAIKNELQGMLQNENSMHISLLNENKDLNDQIKTNVAEIAWLKARNLILEKENVEIKLDYDKVVANLEKLRNSKTDTSSKPSHSFPSRLSEPAFTASPQRRMGGQRVSFNRPQATLDLETSNAAAPGTDAPASGVSASQTGDVSYSHASQPIAHSSPILADGMTAPPTAQQPQQQQQGSDNQSAHESPATANSTGHVGSTHHHMSHDKSAEESDDKDDEEEQEEKSDLDDHDLTRDSINQDLIDDNEPYVTQRSDKRSSVTSAKLRAESVLICDSTPQHVDVNLFMGRLKCFKQRASTSDAALKQLQSWEPSDIVQYAILHEGINDVRANVDIATIISNLKNCLILMREKFPNACIAFSEMLFIGRDNRESAQNRIVQKIITEMENFCILNGFVYAPHVSLNSPTCALFRDDVHPDKDGGTAVFCSDIFRATGYHKSKKDSRDNQQMPGKTMYFYNQRQRNGNGQYASGTSNQRRPNVNAGSSEPVDNPRNFNANLNQMMSLLCMNMLRQQGLEF